MPQKTIEVFHQTYPYLICIDSDGTAMDTMNIKHFKCFGPCFVEEFGLEAHKEEALKRWNQINLYEKSRGQLRYVTLLKILKEYQGKYLDIKDLSCLDDWVNKSGELSTKSLKEAITKTNSDVLKKTLEWSEKTNEAIKKLTFADKKPFKGVKEAFQAMRGKGDVAAVSGAGAKALEEEWDYYGLSELADVLASQEDGTKGAIIGKLLPKGYQKDHVLMIGDAFPDITAAESQGVYFYPIMVKGEEKSWADLKDIYLPIFFKGEYGKYQDKLMEDFYASFE